MTKLPHCVHEALVKTYLGDEIAGHISRDSTAIEAREKAKKKETQTEPATSSIKRKGRPRKGEPKKTKSHVWNTGVNSRPVDEVVYIDRLEVKKETQGRTLIG